MIYGYARGSTSSQQITVPAQRAKIRQYALLHDLGDIEVLTDEATTSKIPLEKRPGGAVLVEAIRQGKVEAIILTKVDRAFRKTAECLTYMEEWNKREVDLHIIDFGGDAISTRTSTGQLILTFFAAVAEWERAIIAERTRAAHKHSHANGKMITRPDKIPYGYKLGGGTPGKKNCEIVPCPKEQATIKVIMDMISRGASTLDICQKLNQAGVKHRNSPRWVSRMVTRIIKRESERVGA